MTVRLRSQGVSWRCLDGEVVLLDLGTSTYFSINGSGSLLWTLVAEGSSVTALVDALVGRFGIDEQRARVDVERFLQSLADRDLLEAGVA